MRMSLRTLDQLRPVLQNPRSTGPDPVYQVFTDLDDLPWINKTIIQPGKIGGEYPKTFGHYNGTRVDETYKLSQGEGVLLLQKGKPDATGEVLLIKTEPGSQILIAPDYAHSWSNVGSTKLVLLDNWNHGHTLHEYKPIEEYHGMAYYLVEEDNQAKAVPNPNYKNLPEPVWLTAEEFSARQAKK